MIEILLLSIFCVTIGILVVLLQISKTFRYIGKQITSALFEIVEYYKELLKHIEDDVPPWIN